MRLRMSPDTLANEPFHELARAEPTRCTSAPTSGQPSQTRRCAWALLDACRRAAGACPTTRGIRRLGGSRVPGRPVAPARTPHRGAAGLRRVADPARAVLQLLATLVDVAAERRSLRALLSWHYALLAAKVAERSAETGKHYITRDRAEYWTC